MTKEHDSWNSQLEKVTSTLSANVLYRLSLTSKELFHSNFLSWLFDTYPSLIGPILDQSLPTDEIAQSSRREHVHLDLILFPKESVPLVIENKVFAPVETNQLRKYDCEPFTVDKSSPKKILVQDCKRFILTLLEPINSTLIPEGWQPLRYDDVRSRLAARRSDVVHDAFHQQLIDGYLSLLDALIELRDTVGRPNADQPLDMTVFIENELPDTRIRDFVSKARFAVARHELITAGPNERVDYEIGFTNGMSLVQGFYRLKNLKHQLGWQYQNGQFRLALRLGPNFESFRDQRLRRESVAAQELREWITEENLNVAFALTRSKLDFEKQPTVTKNDHEIYKKMVPTSNRWDYNSYEPDFVYRWARLSDLTLQEICTANQVLMRRAVEIDHSLQRIY